MLFLSAIRLDPPLPLAVVFVDDDVVDVVQFSLADLRYHKHIHLHREQVRDVKFSGHLRSGGGGYVLSTAFDRTLKVRTAPTRWSI